MRWLKRPRKERGQRRATHLLNAVLSSAFHAVNRKEFVLVLTLITFMLFRLEVVEETPPLHELYDPSTSEDWVVFYNVFVPPKPTRLRRALRMIEEQLSLVDQANTRRPEKILTVFYNTVGERTLARKYVNQICSVRNTLNCLPSGKHHESGFEEITLQSVYDFCHQHPTKTVVYMHSKGTYHQTEENNRWRRHMTAAVTSSSCLYAVSSEDNDCNVCGLSFYPLWSFLFPGNFFTASCDYILKLLPPKKFPTEMKNLVEEISRQVKDGFVTANLFPVDNPGNMGSDRYAAEHWIGSHPSIRPCDMSATEDILYWRLGDRIVVQKGSSTQLDPMFQWSMAPQKSVFNSSWYRLDQGLLSNILANDTLRRTEYFLLGGYMRKWSMLYDAKPEFDSWIWDWFPDGIRWRDNEYTLSIR